MSVEAGSRPPWLLALLATAAIAVVVTSVSLFGFFWIHGGLFALFLAFGEQDRVLRALYIGGGIVFAILAVNFSLEHLRSWTAAGRFNWIYRCAWARRLMGVATGREYLRYVRARDRRRPWIIIDEPHGSHAETDDKGRRADLATLPSKVTPVEITPETIRLAQLAAENVLMRPLREWINVLKSVRGGLELAARLGEVERVRILQRLQEQARDLGARLVDDPKASTKTVLEYRSVRPENDQLADMGARRVFGMSLADLRGALEDEGRPLTPGEYAALVQLGEERGGQDEDAVRQDALRSVAETKAILLREEQIGDGLARLTAKIDEQGDLILEGQDVGEFVERAWGDSDYEYWLTVPWEHKDMVLLWLLKERFDSERTFWKWLEDRHIPWRFHNYA